MVASRSGTAPRIDGWMRWALLLLVVVVGLAIGWGILRPDRGESPPTGGEADRAVTANAVDRAAPPFDLPTVHGEGSIALGDFGGKVVLLDFWASWCPSCRKEAPRMEVLWRRYGPLGVQVLGVNIQDRREDAQAFEREFGITFPSVFDPRAELAAQYGVAGIPTMIVIAPDGRMRYVFPGRPDPKALDRALNEVLRQSGDE